MAVSKKRQRLERQRRGLARFATYRGARRRVARRLRWIAAGAALSGLAALIIWLTDPFASPTAIDADGTRVTVGPIRTPGAAPRVGRIAPDFVLPDYEGRAVRLSDFRGKVVFLNFWATWCTACEREMPDMQRLARKYPDDVVVLAINRGESTGSARAWSDARNLPDIRFVVDSQERVARAYRLGSGMPQSFFIDPEGVIRSIVPGAQSFAQMEQHVLDTRALAGGAASR
jgi:peroxiredoxin